jgi:hypothetical protein
MTTPQAQQLLKAGIKALKSGDRPNARKLLMQVIKLDERNEQAWLWLSGAVTTNKERRTCLQNALSINPDNQLARKGLIKLGGDLDQIDAMVDDEVFVKSDEQKTAVYKELPPLSPAAAVLYPERQVKEWEWQDPTPEHKKSDVGFASETKYDDVWSREDEICAYCAAKLTREDEQCPQCKRKVIANRLRYKTPSSNWVIFWVLLFGISLISLIQVFVSIVFIGNILLAAFNGFLIVVFASLGMGAYFRQGWAYSASIIILVLMLAIAILQFLLPPTITDRLLAGFDESIAGVISGVSTGISGLIRTLQLTAVAGALIVAIFLVPSDFAREPVRQIAIIGRRMSTGPDFHTTAKEAARVGMWATAVLHWQRAAAIEPTNLIYQRYLGQAYAQLGFYQRSLDVLQSARERATHPDKKAQLDQLMQKTKQKIQSSL